MHDWEASKQQFIDKLSNADRTFANIFSTDSENLVIHGEERDKLQQLKDSNKKILDKLLSREFTVAVVGLEKAGKSTLGNALIKSMVLPEDGQRCTYTKTEIRSGSEDIAEVYFYSREEFNKNFKRMLTELKYPDSIDFQQMTLEAFNRYWASVAVDPDLRLIHEKYDTTTAADVKAMLGGKQKILPLLGKPIQNFGPEYWSGGEEFNEFKTYITGMSGKNSDGSVIRQPYPYAVKNVIIRSTQLADMSHLVLYDVPGFDSPTELHKRQTEEMLKESDAIILVTNVGDRPDLTGTQLDMLRNGQDRDGIKLSAKAFVFGNKIDRASDSETARSNFAALRNDVVRNHIALEGHIVSGSARAYLEDENLMTGDVASKILRDWQFSNGIPTLLQKMQDYYDNDRFAVLKQRAEKSLSETRATLQDILDRYSTGDLNSSDVSAKIKMGIQRNLELFRRKANEITRAHVNSINAEKPFTTALQGDIEKIYPLVNDENGHQKLIEDVELSLAIDPDGIYQTAAVNGNVRDKLNKDFKENIVNSATKLTLNRQKELRRELVEAFLKIMGMEAATGYREELEASVNELFDKMLIADGSKCNFNSLVERFVATVIETLILTPFAEEQRRDKVKATWAELTSLSVYYNLPDKSEQDTVNLDSIGSDSVKFFAKIIAHEGTEVPADAEADLDASENENFLRKIFENNKDTICKGAALAVDLMPFGKWAKMLMKAGINLTNIQNDALIKGRDKPDRKLEDFIWNVDWSKLSADQRVNQLEKIMTSYRPKTNQEIFSEPTTFSGQLDALHEKARQAKRMQTKDDMIATLDTDIKILRDITSKSVINAIGLERAFISVVTKNVELIREHLRDEKGGVEFADWIDSNAYKLMPTTFESINEQRMTNENRKAIVSAIKNVLNKWEV